MTNMSRAFIDARIWTSTDLGANSEGAGLGSASLRNRLSMAASERQLEGEAWRICHAAEDILNEGFEK
jgi:hypothetical protein